MKIIVGMTGATGAIFGIRLLEILKSTDVETHLSDVTMGSCYYSN